MIRGAIRNDLLTNVAKERRHFESGERIAEDTRVLLLNNFQVSPQEADFHVNSISSATNLGHRNPNMLAAAIALYIQYNVEMPDRDIMEVFIDNNRPTLGKLKNFRANDPRTREIYLRELVKYYRYVSEVKQRATTRTVVSSDLIPVHEPGVVDIGDIEMIL